MTEPQTEKAHTQYGVQIVWIDPVQAGAVREGEAYDPRWMVFDTEEQADSFASIYVTKLEAGPHNGVAAVNRAQRWAVEEYGPWVDVVLPPATTAGGRDE